MTIVFNLAIFLGSFLLFMVQPMIAKLLLPKLGGSYYVWNTCVFFFQGFLLLGYIYAHLSHKWLGAKWQAIVHLTLLAVSLLCLPIMLKSGSEVTVDQPVTWLLITLVMSIGLPFFLLSANAPMLQNWLAHTKGKAAKNPYLLYVASNIGSLLGLMMYPFIIEPWLPTDKQLNAWSVIYVIYLVSLTPCIILLWLKWKKLTVQHAKLHLKKLLDFKIRKDSKEITGYVVLKWIMLAFIPSSLMLGVTTYITTDIVAMPLIWVLPLMIYLISFIIAFAEPKKSFIDKCINGQMNLTTVIILLTMKVTLLPMYSLHLLCFFAVAMVCHATLAKSKPEVKHLTFFYLCISLGGVLGGFFNTIVAPLVFHDIWEYPLILVAAFALIPFQKKDSYHSAIFRRKVLIGAVLLGLAVAAVVAINIYDRALAGFLNKYDKAIHSQLGFHIFGDDIITIIVIIATFVTLMVMRNYKYAYVAVALAYIVAIAFIRLDTNTNLIYSDRNFYGSLKVKEYTLKDYHIFAHGTTLHGLQSMKPGQKMLPTMYYGDLPVKLLSQADQDANVAVIGLGAGAIACAAEKDQRVTFYEINHKVKEVAENPKYFTFLKDCPAKSHVVIGDGRLEIAKAKDSSYNIIMLDAFSSDFIPVHLLTLEAMDIYLKKLKSRGVMAFHISNRYIDLIPVLNGLAHERGMHILVYSSNPRETMKGMKQEQINMAMPSQWVIITSDSDTVRDLEGKPGWKYPEKRIMLWTDNFSNIFSLLKIIFA